METQITKQTCEGKQVSFEKKVKIATDVDLNICLEQIKFPISVCTWAPTSELQSANITLAVVQAAQESAETSVLMYLSPSLADPYLLIYHYAVVYTT